MKRQLCVMAIILIGLAGLSFADNVLDIQVPPTNSFSNGAIVIPNASITWTVHWTNDIKLNAHDNAFRVFLSSDGTVEGLLPNGAFQPITYDALYDFLHNGDDGGFFINPYGVDGLGADTIKFGGFSIFNGIYPMDRDVYTITTEVGNSQVGNYLCIDSSFAPPGAVWMWSTNSGNVIPYWGGPYCHEIGCCLGNRGNVDLEIGPGGPVDVSDLGALVAYVFPPHTELPCADMGDVDGQETGGVAVNVADISYLIEYLFFGGPEPLPCP